MKRNDKKKMEQKRNEKSTRKKRKFADGHDEQKKKKKPSADENESISSDKTNAEKNDSKIVNERYHPNRFVQNTDSEQQGQSYRYFVRPYVPFWSSQKLTFEQINKETEIPSSRQTGPCSKRYVFQHLVKTWLNDDPWFDKKEIFELVEEDLIFKLNSVSHGYKKEIVRK